MFKNYLVAKDKYQPDFFLYENNKSMSPAIRTQITKELGVEPVLINSALVSAQSRQRLYWVGKRNPDGTYSQVPVEQPEDRGILLRDILETGVCWKEKAYCLAANRGGHSLAHDIVKSKYTYAAEPVFKCLSDKEMEYVVRETKDGRNHFDFEYFHDGNKEKSSCVTANTHKGVPYNVLAEPVNTTTDGQAKCLRATYYKDGIRNMVTNDVDRKTCYEVKDCQITINGKQYPIKLADGFYIIRKLTVTECKRLQTVPESYEFPVSDTQAYKMLGNGWTVDVIVHLLSHFDGLTSEPVEVLSMYDGMSCGHIALDKLGVNITKYWATEIDKYAIQTTQHNFPDVIQLDDAFQVRDESWTLPN